MLRSHAVKNGMEKSESAGAIFSHQLVPEKSHHLPSDLHLHLWLFANRYRRHGGCKIHTLTHTRLRLLASYGLMTGSLTGRERRSWHDLFFKGGRTFYLQAGKFSRTVNQDERGVHVDSRSQGSCV